MSVIPTLVQELLKIFVEGGGGGKRPPGCNRVKIGVTAYVFPRASSYCPNLLSVKRIFAYVEDLSLGGTLQKCLAPAVKGQGH